MTYTYNANGNLLTLSDGTDTDTTYYLTDKHHGLSQVVDSTNK